MASNSKKVSGYSGLRQKFHQVLKPTELNDPCRPASLFLSCLFLFSCKNQQPMGPERPWEEPNIWKHGSILAWRQCGGWSRWLTDFFPPWLCWEWLIRQRTKQMVWVPQVESREYSKTEISTLCLPVIPFQEQAEWP